MKKNVITKGLTIPWTWQSQHSVKQTADRLISILDRLSQVMQFGRINQALWAGEKGAELPDMELLSFENSALVGKLLSANIEVASELPIKVMIWEEADGNVLVRATDIDQMNLDYRLNGADGAIESIRALLPSWIEEAAG